MKKKILFSLLTILLSPSLWAQEAHWQLDEGEFKYDMTVVVALQFEAAIINDWSNYEIAAFCGKECRGVIDPEKDILQYGGNTIAYIRVRSNQLTGENITFKVFDKSTQRVINVQGDVVAFQSDGTQGAPAEPWILDITKNYTLGDANGDGVVNVEDAEAVFNFYMTGESPNFSEAAADFDGDGTVDLTDAVLIYEFCMSNQ